jgi:aspartate carbamoyltransferase catalytic subunit
VIQSSGLLSVKGISRPELFSFFTEVQQSRKSSAKPNFQKVGLLAFFEPSTRTRVSFEAAGLSVGVRWIVLNPENLSLKKGESLKDTFQTLALYRPDFLVVRHSLSGTCDLIQSWTDLPVLNAGDGTHEHPTQALLDAYTLWRRNPKKKYKIAFFGDVARSRVARSDLFVFQALGYEVSVVDDQTEGTHLFAKAFKVKLIPRSKLKTQDVALCLRVQKERGSSVQQAPLSSADLGKNTFVMHPGPAIAGEDLSYELCDFKNSPNNLVHEQVENGFWVRRRLLIELFERKQKK